MRIDKVNQVNSFSTISNDRSLRKPAGEKQAHSTDRVEVASQPNVDQLKGRVKDSIVKAEKQQMSMEKLESIKQRIGQNNYYVDTDAIINSILK